MAITAHRLETESPLEQSLTANVLGWIEHCGIGGVVVETQVPVGPYRADMMITCAGCRLVVKSDGATYHNNPNAIAHDKRRDRYFALQGITVMRFTGAEIRRDPRGCAAEVGMWITRR
jgi:very-short-patch-repair endonuclease